MQNVFLGFQQSTWVSVYYLAYVTIAKRRIVTGGGGEDDEVLFVQEDGGKLSWAFQDSSNRVRSFFGGAH